MNKTILTKNSYEKIKEELEYLKTVKRKEIITRIKEAKEFGDLSENAAYKEARETESLNESRIQKLEHIVKTAEIIDSAAIESKKICIGSEAILEKDGKVYKYTIVDQSQTDYKTNKISFNSPLARALLGKRPGDTISIKTPRGEIFYKIISTQ